MVKDISFDRKRNVLKGTLDYAGRENALYLVKFIAIVLVNDHVRMIAEMPDGGGRGCYRSHLLKTLKLYHLIHSKIFLSKTFCQEKSNFCEHLRNALSIILYNPKCLKRKII